MIHVITISLQCKTVQVSNKPSICWYFGDNTENTATENILREQSLLTQTVVIPFTSTIKEDMNFIFDNVQYSVNNMYEVN